MFRYGNLTIGKNILEVRIMNELFNLADELGIDRMVASRVGRERLRPVKWEDSEVQFAVLMNPEWEPILEKYSDWSVHQVFRKIGFRKSTPMDIDWDEYERSQLAIIFFTGVKQAYPTWLKVEDVLLEPRIAEGDWLWRSGISRMEWELASLSDVDLLVATAGYAKFGEDKTSILHLMEKWNGKELETALTIWRATKRVPSDLEVSYGYLPKRLLCRLAEANFLEKLGGKSVPDDSLLLLEGFWQRCKFEEFEEAPDIFFEPWHDRMPSGGYFGKKNLKFLREPNAEFCLNYGEPGSGKSSIAAFYLLEAPLEKWKEYWGDAWQLCMEVIYPWDEDAIGNFDIILENKLRVPLQVSSKEILEHAGFYGVANLDLGNTWKQLVKCYRDGTLARLRRLYLECLDYEARELILKSFVSWLKGEWIPFPGAKPVDLLTALDRAEKWGEVYDVDNWILFFNFLDGNRWEEKGELWIKLLKWEEGNWKQVSVKEGSDVHGTFCIEGIYPVEQVVCLNGKLMRWEKPEIFTL